GRPSSSHGSAGPEGDCFRAASLGGAMGGEQAGALRMGGGADGASTLPGPMTRIDTIFAGLRSAGRGGLMPFVCGGRPGPGALGDLLVVLEEAGADIIEIGLPFSDPIADGPVIAQAMWRALEAGATPTSVLREVERARSRVGAG